METVSRFMLVETVFYDLSNRAIMTKTDFSLLETTSSFWKRFSDAGNCSGMLATVNQCLERFGGTGNGFVMIGMV